MGEVHYLQPANDEDFRSIPVYRGAPSSPPQPKPQPAAPRVSPGATLAPMDAAVPRPELDAKLDGLRQEMRADSATLRGDFAELRGDISTLRADIRADLATGLGGMSATITKLTSTLEHQSLRLDETASQVANIKWWMLGAVLTIVVAVYGTSVAIQQMTVATFQAAVQLQTPPAQQQPVTVNVMPATPATPASASR